MRKLLKNIIISGRPNTWLRVWGEMIVAAVLASPSHFNSLFFLVGFISVSPLLWTAGYMLNDITDRNLDKYHEVRKQRPITTGAIKVKDAILIILILVSVSLLCTVMLNRTFFFLLIILGLSQILYTLPPFRLKERVFWDVFINGVNSILRFLLGWSTQSSLIGIPFIPLLLFMSLKIVFFLGHRGQNRDLEIKNHINGTISVLSLNWIKIITFIFCLLGVLSFCFSIKEGIFPLVSLISIIGGALPLGISLLKNEGINIYQQEKNLSFRNVLYLSFFIFTNLLALTLIFK